MKSFKKIILALGLVINLVNANQNIEEELFNSAEKGVLLGLQRSLQYLAEQSAEKELTLDLIYKALTKAAKDGDLNIVTYFAERGVNVHPQDKATEAALRTASENGHLDIVKYLVENQARVDLRDDYKRTALKCAESQRHQEIPNYLRKNGGT